MKHQSFADTKTDKAGRRSKRANGFLAATIEVAGKVFQARLKNISLTGALIEVPATLDVGTKLILNRLHLRISATVVRQGENGIGIHFDTALPSAMIEWLKMGTAIPGRKHRSTPNRIPDIETLQTTAPQNLHKNHKVAPGHHERSLPAPGLRPSPYPLDARLAKELLYAQSLLAHASGPILSDHLLLHQYGPNLQEFDWIGQLLADLAKVIATQDKMCAIDQIKNAGLRARLKDQ